MRTLVLFALMSTLSAQAQRTLTLTSIPTNTPAVDTLYVAGTFNNWQPGLPAYRLTRQANNTYSITLSASVTGAIEFKFTRGAWAKTECLTSGAQSPNRTVSASQATYTGTIAAWADLLPGTTTASVSLLSSSFYSPELGRSRSIWLYLPPDYATSQKRYPVLYMHDGQNLFDDRTAFSGEWNIDETLDSLQRRQNDYGCIVIGIANAGGERLNEYSPYRNAQYGGGDGERYIAFITQTLKPYIDANYRTLPGRTTTGLMGSSMGGLISLYGLLARPDVFGRAGVLSPSLWFSDSTYTLAAATTPTRPAPRIYLLSGRAESRTQVVEQARMTTTLVQAGYQIPAELDTATRPGGTHSESFWRREFGQAYRYLFADLTTATNPEATASPTLSAYPNPARQGQRVEVRSTNPKASTLLIQDLSGKTLLQLSLKHGLTSFATERLRPGVYLLRCGGDTLRWVRD